MTETEFYKILAGIRPADEKAMALARERQAKLAKPPGSLGKLEEIAIRMAGVTGRLFNELSLCRVLVFAADNGVVAEGVASTPQSVTMKQAVNMTLHKTGMSALAAHYGCGVTVVDAGINADLPKGTGVVDRKIAYGTWNLRHEPAMTRAQALEAVGVGIDTVLAAKAEGCDMLGIGEMGIGNTTTSAAVLSALTGLAPETVTGRGSGLTDAAFELKKQVISEALALHKPDACDPIDVITKVGGFDIAAMTGAYIACAAERLPAVADGFISVTAALCAVRLCPMVKDFIFLSHESCEAGYKAAAAELGAEPFLRLDMRLGEGSGCPLAFSVIRAACAVMRDMATFDEAQINDDYLEKIRDKNAFLQ